MVRRLLALFLVLLLGALPALAVEAAGIPSSEMNYCAATQGASQWCWAACIQMVLRRHGVEMDQATIVERTYGRDPFGRLPDWPASFETITRNLNGWGIDQRGRRYTIASRFGQGAPPAALLVAEMRARRPVILAYQSGPMSGHAVVCTGVTFTETPGGVVVHSIVVRDPSPLAAAAGLRGRVEYSAASIARFITGWWTVSVDLGAAGDRRGPGVEPAPSEEAPVAVEGAPVDDDADDDAADASDAAHDGGVPFSACDCATCAGEAFVRCPSGPCCACGWSGLVLCPRCFPVAVLARKE